jgi:mono/diheme cytochrome c family protein
MLDRVPGWKAASILLLGASVLAPVLGTKTARATRQTPAQLGQGQALYGAHCASCHGVEARGTGKGPTFLSKTYTPYLHADIAFRLAVERGVRAHHFRFGDMPKIPGVSREDVQVIVDYVRWLQREAGVY